MGNAFILRHAASSAKFDQATMFVGEQNAMKLIASVGTLTLLKTMALVVDHAGDGYTTLRIDNVHDE
jgi:hypothetical protein